MPPQKKLKLTPKSGEQNTSETCSTNLASSTVSESTPKNGKKDNALTLKLDSSQEEEGDTIHESEPSSTYSENSMRAEMDELHQILMEVKKQAEELEYVADRYHKNSMAHSKSNQNELVKILCEMREEVKSLKRKLDDSGDGWKSTVAAAIIPQDVLDSCETYKKVFRKKDGSGYFSQLYYKGVKDGKFDRVVEDSYKKESWTDDDFKMKITKNKQGVERKIMIAPDGTELAGSRS